MFLNINDKFKEFLSVLYSKACELNLRIFIVGGAVRDYFLNLDVKDYDLIVEGNAIDFATSIGDLIQIKSIHKDFGTVKVIYKDIEYDLASTRIESYPYSGCLPVVSKVGVPIEEDYLRRDFTINSMYFEILDNDFKVVDLANGADDIKNKTLRVLHDKSYIDDPTRIFRGLAFKYRFGFDFSSHDKALIDNYLKSVDYSNMSDARNISVFKKSLQYPFGLILFKEIIEKNYYKILTPNEINIDYELIKDIIEIFDLDYIDFSEFCSKIVLSDIQPVQITDNILDNYITLSKLNRFDLAYLYYCTKSAKITEYLKAKNIKLSLKGSDIINLGFKEGKQIGDILDKLLEYKLNNPNLNLNYNEELDWVKSNFPLN